MYTQKFYPLIIGGLLKHAFRFLRVSPGALSTRHMWHAIVLPDVYTRICFSESMGSWFGGPRQKALQTMNEFTLFVDFCLIPLSKTCSLYQPRNCKDGFISIVTRPLISLRYAVCLTRRWSIIGHCVGACQWSSCAEERRPVMVFCFLIGSQGTTLKWMLCD